MNDKIYFRIGEVAELVGVKPHVLRSWEQAVPAIRPGKTPSNQRRYRRRDVELFREIDRLLHHEGYTLPEIRQKLVPSVAADGVAIFTAKAISLADAVDAAAQRFDDCDPFSVTKPTPTPTMTPLATTEPPVSRLRMARLRAGLLDLIHMAGEEP